MTTKKKSSKAKVKIDPTKKLKTELKIARAEVNRLVGIVARRDADIAALQTQIDASAIDTGLRCSAT